MKLAEMKGFVRTALAHAQDRKCSICGERLRPEWYAGPEACTIDHVVPASKRDTRLWSIGNHLAAHAKCNHDKGDREPTPCEVILLFVVNRRLNFPEYATRNWDEYEGTCHHAHLAQSTTSQ